MRALSSHSDSRVASHVSEARAVTLSVMLGDEGPNGPQPTPDPTPPSRRQRWAAAFGPTWIAGIAATLIVAAILGLIASSLSQSEPASGGGSDEVKSRQESGRLELAAVAVRNETPPAADTRSDNSKTVEQPRQSTPTVDITLLNRGSRRVLVTGVRIDIEAYAEVRECIPVGGGDLVTAGRYSISLPDNPRGGDRRITRRLYQQVGPDEADRFVLRFAAPDFHDKYSLYVLRIRMQTTETGRTIDAGRVLISTPVPVSVKPGPTGASFYFPVDDGYLTQVVGRGNARVVWCFRRNLDELRRIVGLEGHRDAAVAALNKVVTASRWKALSRRFPAREAAVELVDGDSGDPLLAAYAAAQIGDHAFETDIRRRSADALVQNAKHWLAESTSAQSSGETYPFKQAISDARASLDLRQTTAARDVLRQAERGLAALTQEPRRGGAP